ncbi:MAG: hypothetical protein ACTSRW_09920 [Candidatus Helarchaeota archaeon]
MGFIVLLGIIPIDAYLLFAIIMLGILVSYIIGVILTKQSLYVLLELLISVVLILLVPSLFLRLDPTALAGLAFLPEIAWIWRIVLIIIELGAFGIKVIFSYNEGWKTLKEDTFKD